LVWLYSRRDVREEAQMSWKLLQEQDPELATFGERRFRSRVAYLATVDADGSPRVHPVTPIVTPGRLVVFMEPTSPKGRDLLRGSRYALHCSVEDDEGGGGEFRVRGGARQVTDLEVRGEAAEHAPYEPSQEYLLFELLVDDAFSTTYTADGTPVRQKWIVGH
jgi:hypothetical protein